MNITYGIEGTQIDITDVAKATCMKSSIIYIPPDDNVRAKLFTDPIFKTVKSIFINGQSYGPETHIFIDTDTKTVYTERLPEYITAVYPEQSVTVQLQSLHSRLSLLRGSFRDELPEQKMAVRFLRPEDRVLEIGGNVGRNSLIIASIVGQNSLVVLESDPDIAKQLEENRNANGMTFAIEASALSTRPLIQRGWDTMVSETVPEGYKRVNTISLSNLRAKYSTAAPFTTLVLDCEGAFYYILLDMPEILEGITTIIMENDYYDTSHKEYIDTTLTAKGFRCVYSEALGPEYDFKQFPYKDKFFEVWKLAQ
jgi:FkbM family methyltransferase